MSNPESRNDLTVWRWTPPPASSLADPAPRVLSDTPRRTALPLWLFIGALLCLVGLAAFTSWTIWTWRAEQTALLQRDLAELQQREAAWQANQQRHAAALEEIRQQLMAPPPVPSQPPPPVAPTPTAPKLTASLSVPQPSRPAPVPEPLSPPTPPTATPAPTPAVVPQLEATPPAPAERVKLSLSKEPASTDEPSGEKPRRSLKKFFTSSLFVDSAVLTTSVLVPPSIPLTMAQSRLGRRLTGRILRKTKTDKTLGAKVIRDVGDMPITQRRRR